MPKLRIALVALHFAEYSINLAVALSKHADVLLCLYRENANNKLGEDWLMRFKHVNVELLQAVHAHNLYLQAFSRAGFIGRGALLLLLAYIIRNALNAASVSAGGSLALLVMFLVRSITEVPLQPNGILGGEFFAFMALLIYTTDRALRAKDASVNAQKRLNLSDAETTVSWGANKRLNEAGGRTSS